MMFDNSTPRPARPETPARTRPPGHTRGVPTSVNNQLPSEDEAPEMTTADQLSPATRADIDDAIVELMVAGMTTAEVAAAIGRSASTVYRRLRSPAVRARITEGRAEVLRPHLRALQSATGRAIDYLVQVLDLPNHHASTKVRAAVAIVELAMKLTHFVELAPRVAALEAGRRGRDELDTDPDPAPSH
jgi:AcrR family transcriptional regulator